MAGKLSCCNRKEVWCIVKTRLVTNQIDMIGGPLLPGILRFALPLAVSNILQLAFNAADIIVLGKFSGQTALAAVGATTSLINLITTLFLGLSVGVNVLVANNLGARRHQEVQDSVHCGLLIISELYHNVILFCLQI